MHLRRVLHRGQHKFDVLHGIAMPVHFAIKTAYGVVPTNGEAV